MIFVTVGTQIPFDRMVTVVDQWTGRSGADVFAQVGPTTHVFPHLRATRFLQPAEFDRYFEAAELVIAHAGMGTILTALSHGKPIIVMPRKAALGEHRNDHQLATAKRFDGHPGIKVVWDEHDLAATLDGMELQSISRANQIIASTAPRSFIDALRALIDA